MFDLKKYLSDVSRLIPVKYLFRYKISHDRRVVITLRDTYSHKEYEMWFTYTFLEDMPSRVLASALMGKVEVEDEYETNPNDETLELLREGLNKFQKAYDKLYAQEAANDP